MILLPAIDLKDGMCVRLVKGDYSTAHKVSEDPLTTAKLFEAAGAKWLHTVDLDGAKAKTPVNREPILNLIRNTGLSVEVGGGIRDEKTVSDYLENGAARVILGSAALSSPALVKTCVQKYGAKIAVGIDARNGKVAAEGWVSTSEVGYLELARQMEALGVQTLIFTDISRDGTLSGPNLEMLYRLSKAVSCDLIASGGVSGMQDITELSCLGLSGAICGKALYSGALDLGAALRVSEALENRTREEDLTKFFVKSDLIPAVIQEDATGEVLMLAYMNRETLRLTLETGTTWFYSRSRGKLWNKGATSGHTQEVLSVYGDCDNDTLLVRVRQNGNACHTGSHSCFFNKLKEDVIQ